MKSILLCSMLFFGGMLFGQDEVRNLSDFDELDLSGGIAVDLRYGKPKAEITLVKGSLENLVTEVKGGALKIYFENKGWGKNSGNNKAKIVLYFKHLEDISVSAGAALESNETLTADDLDCDASSGARIELNVEAASVDSNVSSGASMQLTGETKELDIDVSSGGSFRGAGLKAKNVDADASSGGSAKVWATYSIDAGASSGGIRTVQRRS